MYFPVFDRLLFTAIPQPCTSQPTTDQWLTNVEESCCRNFVSCSPYFVGNVETRKILSWNSQATIMKHIWIVSQLVTEFSDTLSRDCCSTKYLDLDMGIESCLETASQQLRDIFRFVKELFHPWCRIIM